MKHIQTKEFLSIKETCLLLGISRMSLYRYIKSGNILSLQLGGRVIIKRAILDSLLNK
ncbi:MAG: helix-turn-helix domain-containing protein [bacterium]|nr:helix-turn-helix domain-containing protein [bacterium]